MTPIKYVACGGWVISRHDGQHHYIPAHEVAKLYGVDETECIMVSGLSNTEGFNKEYLQKLIWLTPREDGKYELGNGSNLDNPPQTHR